MIYELEKTEYERVRHLSQPLLYHLSSAAVLDGDIPGRVFVDNRAYPQSAFIDSPEGSYLAGNPDNRWFNRALMQAMLSGELLGRKPEAIYFVCHPERWRTEIVEQLNPRPVLEMTRRHYLCREVSYQWRADVPKRFQVLPISDVYSGRGGLKIPSHVTNWMVRNWGSTHAFLRKATGFATVHDNEVVSWSLMDCRSGDACEIGIHTKESYRKRGLGAITAAATAEFLLSSSYSRVGWHCPDSNIGSYRTAEKIGFERERNYTMYYIYLKDKLN